MKRVVSLLLVTLLTVGLFAGCGKKEEKKQPSEQPKKEQKKEVKKDETKKEAKVIKGKALFKNLNARKAIAMALEKKFIADEIEANGSKAVDFLVPKGLANDSKGKDFRAKYPEGWNHFDADKAKEYWAKAKKELGFDKAEIELLNYDSESSRRIGEYIQGQLQKNLDGLKVSISQQPFKNKLKLAKEGNFEFQFAGWGPDYPDPMTFLDMWITGSGFNDAGYSNPTYDQNIKDTKTGKLTTDIAKRWEVLQDSEKMLVGDDCIVVPLFQRGRSIVMQPYVKGIQFHNFGGDYTYKTATTEKVDENGKKVIRLTDTSDIPSMDTNKATDAVSFKAMDNVLEGLYMLAENDVVEPGVAESYDVSDDGLTYTFHLRKNAKWSNGDPVTAKDFVYGWRRLADPKTGSQYAFMTETAGLKNAKAITKGDKPVEELGVKAVDDYTLVAELENPVPYFIKLMTFPNFYPVNQKFVEKVGDKFGTSPETILYNGAFTLSKWKIGYEYEYAKNPTYWNADTVKVDAVNFRIVKDGTAAVNLYEAGDVDRVGLTSEHVEKYIDDPNFGTLDEVVTFYLVFNVGKGE